MSGSPPGPGRERPAPDRSTRPAPLPASPAAAPIGSPASRAAPSSVAVRAPQQVGHRLTADPILGHILLRNLGYMHRPCALRHTRQHDGNNGKDTFTTRYRLGYIFHVDHPTCWSTWKTRLSADVTSD